MIQMLIMIGTSRIESMVCKELNWIDHLMHRFDELLSFLDALCKEKNMARCKKNVK